jgi:hypothetical protein
VATVALSLLAAFLFASASVLQQAAAAQVPEEEARGLWLIRRLVRRPLWLAGGAADASGYGAEAAALAFGSILVVQPILATTLLFAIPLSAAFAGTAVRPRDVGWAALLTAGIAVFLVVGRPSAGLDRAPLGHWLVAVAVLAPLILACIGLGARRPGPRRALSLGIAAGLLFGVMAGLTKSVVHLLGTGFVDLLTSWEPYALAGVAGAGLLLQQSAYQAGALSLSLPALAVLEPVTATAIGIGVFEETVRASGAGWALIGASAVAMAAGLIALSRPGIAPGPQVTKGVSASP